MGAPRGNLNAATDARRLLADPARRHGVVEEIAALYARQGSIERTADRLGYSLPSLYRWLRTYHELRSAFDAVLRSRP